MIKVDIISGFLGSGKTTLIKKLLKAHENEKVVLIENEFGEIGIDGEIIEREGFEVFEISNGCICCIMQKDFVEMLSRVIEDFKPERIVIEPTGISILSEIIEIISRTEFKDICKINSIVTVVDSVNYLEQSEAFGEFFEDQITNAKTLILSKSQFCDDNKIEKIIQSLKILNSEAKILTSNWNELTLDDIGKLLNEEKNIEFKELFHAKYKPCCENEFDTFALETRKKYSKQELSCILSELKESIYGSVLRGKGFIKGTDCFFDFSYTNGEFTINESKIKTSGKICLIGKELNEKRLKKLFDSKNGGIFSWLKF